MNRELSYAYEKFSIAVGSMASSAAPIQRRLHSAYMSFHPVQARDFKDEGMRGLYMQIMDGLTKVKDPDTGYVPATLAQMTDEEAQRIAGLIVDLFFSIARAHLKGA